MTTAAKTRRGNQGDRRDAFAQINRLGAVTSLATTSQAYIDAIGKCQGEVCSFVTKRLTDDLSHGQNLAKCKDWAEAATLQQEWLRQTVQDYVSEGEKLWQLGTRAAASIRAE